MKIEVRDHPNSMVTVWIALDDVDEGDGYLLDGDDSNLRPILSHTAPEGQLFNLTIPADVVSTCHITPALVPHGGISFHHGNTLRGSDYNQSVGRRRAFAIHYGNGDTAPVDSTFTYDLDVLFTF